MPSHGRGTVSSSRRLDNRAEIMSSTVCLSVCPCDYFLLPQPPPRILYVQAAREHAAATFKQAFG